MNAPERFAKTFRFEKTDHVLTYDLLYSLPLFERFAGTEGSIIERNARMMRAIVLDCTRSIFDPHKHWLLGKVRCWEEFLAAKPGGFEVKSRGGTSWIAARPFTDVEGLTRNLPRMPRKEEVADWYVPILKEIKRAFDRVELVFIGATEGPLTDAYDYVDLELFSRALYDAPDEVNYILDVTTEWARILAELYCEYPTSQAFAVCDDVAYKTATIFSPAWLRKNIYDRWKAIYRPLKEKELNCIFHSDGNLNSILDGLVHDVGIEGLNPIEPTAGMNIAEIARMYPRLVLLGNLDTAGVLTYGTPEEVRAAVNKLLHEVGTRGGLCLGSSTEIGDAVPIEKALAMYQAARNFRF